MLFLYKAITKEGAETSGGIEAQNQDSVSMLTGGFVKFQ